MLIMLILMLICTITCQRMGQGVAVTNILHNTRPTYAKGANFRISHVHTCFMFSEDLTPITLNMTLGSFLHHWNTNLESYLVFSANLPYFWSIRWLMIEQHQHEIIISSNLTCSQHFWFDHNFDDNIWHFVRRFVLIIKWEFSLG